MLTKLLFVFMEATANCLDAVLAPAHHHNSLFAMNTMWLCLLHSHVISVYLLLVMVNKHHKKKKKLQIIQKEMKTLQKLEKCAPLHNLYDHSEEVTWKAADFLWWKWKDEGTATCKKVNGATLNCLIKNG